MQNSCVEGKQQLLCLSVGSAQRALKIHTLQQCKEIGNGDTLESVGRFGYLGDMQIVEQTVWLLWGMMCLEEVQRVVSHLDFQRGIT